MQMPKYDFIALLIDINMHRYQPANFFTIDYEIKTNF